MLAERPEGKTLSSQREREREREGGKGVIESVRGYFKEAEVLSH